MNAIAIGIALALARPVDVLEEWEIVSLTPPRESVTARGVFRRADGPDALLPRAVQGDARPSAFSPGVVSDLAVTRGPSGWQVRLPSGDADTVRVVARVERPTERPHLFRLAWPRLATAWVPTRRVVQLDRAWLATIPSGWTCAADDFSNVVPCVSTEASPAPLEWHLPAPTTRRLEWVLAIAAILGAAALAAWAGARERWRERAVGAAGGAIVGASVALSGVGALVCGWAVALLTAGVACTLVGALASRRTASALVGGLALLAVPLLVVVDGRWMHVVPVTASVAAVAIVLSVVPRRAGSEDTHR